LYFFGCPRRLKVKSVNNNIRACKNSSSTFAKLLWVGARGAGRNKYYANPSDSQQIEEVEILLKEGVVVIALIPNGDNKYLEILTCNSLFIKMLQITPPFLL
jgi:hypothetical protein